MAHNPSQIGRITVAVMFLIILGGSSLLMYLMHAPSAELVRKLDSPDPQIVIDNLVVLKERHDGAGVVKATPLLKSDNIEIWSDAALYLGAMGKPESIPYLIKAMHNVDRESQDEVVGDLTELTGQSFGGNVNAWEDWWLAKHPQDSDIFKGLASTRD